MQYLKRQGYLVEILSSGRLKKTIILSKVVDEQKYKVMVDYDIYEIKQLNRYPDAVVCQLLRQLLIKLDEDIHQALHVFSRKVLIEKYDKRSI